MSALQFSLKLKTAAHENLFADKKILVILLLLRKKAEKLGIAAFNLPEFIVIYYQHGSIDQHACITRLEKLVTATVLSKAVYRKLLEIMKQ